MSANDDISTETISDLAQGFSGWIADKFKEINITAREIRKMLNRRISYRQEGVVILLRNRTLRIYLKKNNDSFLVPYKEKYLNTDHQIRCAMRGILNREEVCTKSLAELDHLKGTILYDSLFNCFASHCDFMSYPNILRIHGDDATIYSLKDHQTAYDLFSDNTPLSSYFNDLVQLFIKHMDEIPIFLRSSSSTKRAISAPDINS